MKTQILRVFSLIAVLFIILGIPALLITVSGNPFASLDMVGGVIASIDGALTFLLQVFIPIIAWIGWASLVIPLIIEAAVQVRHGESVKLPGVLRLQQNIAAVLIGMILASTAGISGATAVESGGTAGVPVTPNQTISAPATAQAQYGAPSATEKAQASQTGPSYMVNGRQALWDIAETTLGDGSRYVEIFNLNQGVVQKDGAALLSTDQLLHDGWVLTLPQDAKIPQPIAGTGTVTIKPGDTLSEIALENYGDMEAYHYIAGAASRTTQPDGTTIQDADLIQPGWEFTMPGTPTASTTPATPATPATNGNAGSSDALAPSAGSSSASGVSSSAGASTQAPSAATSASAAPVASSAPAAPVAATPAASAAAGASTAPTSAPSATSAASSAISADEAAASVGSSSAHGAPKGQHTTAPAAAPTSAPAATSAASSAAVAGTSSSAPATTASSAAPSAAAVAQNPAQAPAPAAQQGATSAIPGGTIATESAEKTGTTEQAGETDKGSSSSVQTHDVQTAGSTQDATVASAEDEENNYTLPLTGGALLAAGLLSVFAARRWHQRRRRQPGQTTQLTPEAAATLTTLEAEAAVAPLAEIDYGLRLLAQHCRDTATAVPVLKYLAISATEANLYFEQDITNLPAPFQSTMDANLWNLPFGSLDTSEPLDISAPYPALITVGDDTQGAALMLNLEYVGTLQLHDPFQGTGQVNTINQIIGSIAAELLLNPWAEGLHLSLLGLDDAFLNALSADRITTYSADQSEECLAALTAEAQDLQNFLESEGYASVHEARMAGAESFPAHIVIVSDTIDEMDRSDLLDLVRDMPNVAIAVISHEEDAVEDLDTNSRTHRLTVTRAPHGDISDTMLELQPVRMPLIPRYLTKDEEEAILALLKEAAAEPTDAPEKVLRFPEVTSTATDSPAQDQLSQDSTDAPAESPVVVDTPAEATAPEETTDEPAVEEAPETAPEPEPATEPAETTNYGIDTSYGYDTATTPEEATTPAPAEATAPEETTDELAADEAPAPETEAPTALAPACYEEGKSPEEIRAETQQVFAHLFGETDMYDALVKDGSTLTHETVTNLEHPFLALLGPVRLLNAKGPAPLTKGKNEVSTVLMDRYAAVAAFLHLHPGVETEDYHAAFWPGEHHSSTKADTRRNQLTGKVRQWLGSTKDRHPYFPRAVSRRYSLSELINSDWALFQILTDGELALRPTSHLLAAFSLVRGVPLDGSSAHYPWAENDREKMRTRIIDVAYELLDRARVAQDHRLILQIARAARMIDSTQDAFWMAEIHEEILTNNLQKAQQLKTQFLDYLESWDVEPSEEAAKVLAA
ncbi:hypothetical protein [Rothia mucilaginosa]|uniref:hypothetical protein n=1 Tax=Rothia mucilaginosa TaxID=43675 RepID=UPI0028D12606|nr:hypothetical protein [Rothia mucilaginosa]